MVKVKSRAVSEEQKAKRRQDILDSARDLFDATSDYHSLLMKHIAENINLTKGTLYLYFKTKEEVFLALYSNEFNRIFDEIDAAFLTQERMTPLSFVKAFSEQVMQQTTFLRLNSLLHGVLEQNIRADVALPFKTLLRDRLMRTGAEIERVLPQLKAGQGADLLLSLHSLMIGCFQATAETPCLEEILNRTDMAFMKLDFDKEFSKGLRMLVLAYCFEDELAQLC